jgi:hypothetical protein
LVSISLLRTLGHHIFEEENVIKFFRRWNNLPTRKKQIIGAVILSLSLLNFISGTESGSQQNQTSGSSALETSGAKPFPKLDDKNDGVLENIIRDFHAANETNDWWDRVTVIKEGLIGNETAKMVYIKTDYRLDNVDDVEDATLLCNALVSFVPREGLSVRVDGLIEKGRTLLDGEVETAVVEEWATEFGASWDPGRTPDWCVAKTWFTAIRDGLQQRGWKQRYGSGDLTEEEKRRVFTGTFMQDGSIWFVN